MEIEERLKEDESKNLSVWEKKIQQEEIEKKKSIYQKEFDIKKKEHIEQLRIEDKDKEGNDFNEENFQKKIKELNYDFLIDLIEKEERDKLEREKLENLNNLNKPEEKEEDNKNTLKDIRKIVTKNTVNVGGLDAIFDLKGKKGIKKYNFVGREGKKVLKKGFQKKKGNLFIKSGSMLPIWTKKFFVLREDKFMYFPSKEAYKTGSKAEMSIFLQYASIDKEDSYKKRPYCYSISSRGNVIYIDPETADQLREWMTAIKHVISSRWGGKKKKEEDD
jgi:hypothetical protein